jgi:nitrate/TMAO reductase-like tetraheme cytochrome c subunit
MNEKEKKVFEKILSKKCPTCGSYDIVEEKDTTPVIFMASDFPLFGGRQKKVDILRCNKCHSIHQSDGNSVTIK